MTAPGDHAQSVAITGGAAGLGAALAVGFAERGHRVFASDVSSTALDDLRNRHPDLTITTAVCDITDEEHVRLWADEIDAELGGRGLDIVINNAGILTPGPLEVLGIGPLRNEFDVNVFGSLAVIFALLPSLRRAAGRIVQIGSVSGFLPLPFDGATSASKAAMEAFADVFRSELRTFGVDFVMVAPGSMSTAGPAKTAAQLERLSSEMSDEQRALYGDQFDAFANSLNDMQASGMSAEEAAAEVIELAVRVPPPARGTVGDDARELRELIRDKTDDELDELRRQMLGIG
ncbi:MAG: SDR family NAD(P)-dependent oxidoreductase [Actinomycetota bacterium]